MTTTHEVLVDRKPHQVNILERNDNTFSIEVNGKTVSVKIKYSNQGKTAIIEVEGKPYKTHVEKVQKDVLKIGIDGRIFEVQRQHGILAGPTVKPESVIAVVKRQMTGSVIEKNAVVAPIAGRIMLLKVKVGEEIEKGACVCVLEAMKMENEIAAPRKGVIREIRVSEGTVVNKEDVLAIVA